MPKGGNAPNIDPNSNSRHNPIADKNRPLTGHAEDPSSKSEAKAMMAQEEHEARKEHSKSGANTGQKQGMEYVPRKTHSADVPHND